MASSRFCGFSASESSVRVSARLAVPHCCPVPNSRSDPPQLFVHRLSRTLHDSSAALHCTFASSPSAQRSLSSVSPAVLLQLNRQSVLVASSPQNPLPPRSQNPYLKFGSVQLWLGADAVPPVGPPLPRLGQRDALRRAAAARGHRAAQTINVGPTALSIFSFVEMGLKSCRLDLCLRPAGRFGVGRISVCESCLREGARSRRPGGPALARATLPRPSCSGEAHITSGA